MDLIKKFFKKKAKIDLWYSKRKEIALFETLEAYLTERIMSGESTKKSMLVDAQNRLDEAKKIIEFIKK